MGHFWQVLKGTRAVDSLIDRAITTSDLGKSFRFYNRPIDKVIERIQNSSRHTEAWALRNVDLVVNVGEIVGVIGRNGSGKSTLLQLLAGTISPTSGTAVVQGRVGSLLELGGAFHPDFTGRENATITCALMGLSASEIARRISDIEAFADVGDFFDRPVKIYSSGMYVRVAFAAVSHVDADVLLIDEAIQVGDIGFQHRCMHRFHEMREQGKTIVLVSHSPETIKSLCTRAILLDQGRVVVDDEPEVVVNRYLAIVQTRMQPAERILPARDLSIPEFSELKVESVSGFDRSDGRWGSGAAEILGLDILDETGHPTREVDHGSKLNVIVTARFNRVVKESIVGIVIRNPLGVDVTRTNTDLESNPLGAAQAGEIVTCRFRMALPGLAPGSYAISPAIAEGTMLSYNVCDWIENAAIVHIGAVNEVHGQMRFPCSVSVTRSVATNEIVGVLTQP